MFEGKLAQANGRLKSAKTGVTIEARGNRLCLRAVLPPKPGSSVLKPSQQRLTLGYHANPAGLKLAEQEARKVGALLDCGEFDWTPYCQVLVTKDSVADWVSRFEADYFTRRERTPKSETTWRDDYARVFRSLPHDEPLTVALLTAAISTQKPDSRNRKRWADVCGRLAQFAGLAADFKPLRGKYSSKSVCPRDLPDDATIARWRGEIPNPAWQRAYGLIAAYGLRPSELVLCNFDRFPILQAPAEGKTGWRRIYPFYPEWVEEWELAAGELPKLSGRCNTDLGQRVSKAFSRYHIPYPPYHLRHAWAVRTLEFGLDITLAAQQMGHSLKVHSEIYHAWISEDVHQRAYEVLMNRVDRPMAPTAKISQ